MQGIKAPKRALSAYMIYSNQIRPELMKQNPEMKITEISGHIAEKWKSLGDTDRAKLQAQADSLRKEYELQKVSLSPWMCHKLYSSYYRRLSIPLTLYFCIRYIHTTVHACMNTYTLSFVFMYGCVCETHTHIKTANMSERKRNAKTKTT